jgi:hypothetical protein
MPYEMEITSSNPPSPLLCGHVKKKTCKKKKKKSLDLPLYFFLFSPHMYICTVINSLVEDGYCEASSYYRRLDPGNA